MSISPKTKYKSEGDSWSPWKKESSRRHRREEAKFLLAARRGEDEKVPEPAPRRATIFREWI